MLRGLGTRAARLVLAAGLVGLAAPAVQTAAAPTPAAAADAKVLRVALVTGIDTLNPFTAVRLASTQVGRFMYEFLTTYTAGDQTPTPGLAESWTTSEDKLTWTFKIRQGMTWSDGQPVTAKDPAFTYNLMMTDPDAATANGSYTANFAKVEATDDSTLVITTKTPYASMLGLDIPVVPEHVWSGVKDIAAFTNEDTGQPVVSDGPFLLNGYKEGQLVSLKANPTYWRGKPKFDEVQLITYTDTDAAVQALRKGEVDLVNGLTATQFSSLNGQQDIATNDGHNRRFSSLLINPGAATKDGAAIGDGSLALKDVTIRQAIAQALDLNTLVAKVQLGHAQVGASIIPPVFPAYHWEPTADQRRKFDPAAANAALDAAGFTKGGDGIRVAAGTRLSLRLLTISGDPTQAAQAQYLTSWLKDIGVEVKTTPKSDQQVDDDTTAGDYDLAFSGWSVSPDPDQMLALETCGQRPEANGKGGSTADFFCNSDYDALYAQQAGEPDPAKRAPIVKQMQELLYDQVPSVVLSYNNALEAYRTDRISGVERQPADGGVITGQNGYWWIYSAAPVTANGGAATGDGSTGSKTWVWILVAVVVVGAVGVFLVTRRRSATADDRE